jgi:hypothetical protein
MAGNDPGLFVLVWCARCLDILSVIAREGGQSRIPEAAVIEPRSRGVLDAPVKPGHDSRCVGG